MRNFSPLPIVENENRQIQIGITTRDENDRIAIFIDFETMVRKTHQITEEPQDVILNIPLLVRVAEIYKQYGHVFDLHVISSRAPDCLDEPQVSAAVRVFNRRLNNLLQLYSDPRRNIQVTISPEHIYYLGGDRFMKITGTYCQSEIVKYTYDLPSWREAVKHYQHIRVENCLDKSAFIKNILEHTDFCIVMGCFDEPTSKHYQKTIRDVLLISFDSHFTSHRSSFFGALSSSPSPNSGSPVCQSPTN